MRVRILPLVIAAILTAPSVQGQDPTFEVAVLKRNTSGATGMRVGQPGNRYEMTNGDIRTLILNAYGPRNNQLVGAPRWVETDRYDLIATFAPRSPSEQVRAMLRAFLAERLKLRAHFEDRERDVYELRVARKDGKLGPSIRPTPRACAAAAAAVAAGGRPPQMPAAQNGAPPCGLRSNPGELLAGGITMDLLSRNLGGRAGRIIIDRTGLAGHYELELRYSPDPGAPTDQNADAPSLFTALREQLGLQLDSARAPIQTLVIDHVEKPTDDQN